MKFRCTLVLCAAALLNAAEFTAIKKDHTVTAAELIKQFEAPAVVAYALEPGDQITVTAWNRPELSGTQTVGPDGKITVELAGTLSVAGLTREQCQQAIRSALAIYYTDLPVTVRIDRYSSFQVFVLGRVGIPGALNFDKQPTLLEVLSRAASLPASSANVSGSGLTRCAVFRGKDRVIWIDVQQLLKSGNLALNIRLARNDLVYLPDSDEQSVYVLGSVRAPGAFRLKSSMSFLDALAQAGGATDDGVTGKIELIRPSTGIRREISLKDLRAGKSELNVSLEDSDIIYVPRSGLAHVGYFLQKVGALTGFGIIATAVANNP